LHQKAQRLNACHAGKIPPSKGSANERQAVSRHAIGRFGPPFPSPAGKTGDPRDQALGHSARSSLGLFAGIDVFDVAAAENNVDKLVAAIASLKPAYL
jgi:hypothetical protein